MRREVPSTDILGIKIDALNMPLAIELIEEWIERREKQYICICTVHSIMAAQEDPSYRDVLNGAGLRTPDGMPLVWLSRRAGQSEVSRVAGPDLMPELVARSCTTGHRHYFYGGEPGVVEDLTSHMTDRFPDLHLAGQWTPSIQATGAIESDEVIARMNQASPDIVWVGLGTPKQDVWALNHLHRLNAPIVIAVGAAFDFHSGRVRRAPLWMQKRGLEWVFRLSQDPRRLWKRYLLGNVQFLVAVVFKSYRPKRREGRI